MGIHIDLNVLGSILTEIFPFFVHHMTNDVITIEKLELENMGIDIDLDFLGSLFTEIFPFFLSRLMADIT